MQLNKICSCGQKLTTKNTKNKGRNSLGLWFDCKNCGSTGILRPSSKSVMSYINKIKPIGEQLVCIL